MRDRLLLAAVVGLLGGAAMAQEPMPRMPEYPVTKMKVSARQRKHQAERERRNLLKDGKRDKYKRNRRV
jgi:hypothetical protein